MKKDDMIMKMGIVHILDSVVGMPVLSDCPIAVSYTHLTLPTKLEV